MNPFFGNGKKNLEGQKETNNFEHSLSEPNPRLAWKSHIVINVLVVLVLFFGSYFGWENINKDRAQATRDFVYLDPVDTAFAVENLAKYTPSINENLNYLEETLFFNQDHSEEYLSKSLASDLITEQTQLERDYIVQEGDSITGIAKKFDMHVGTIYERNNLNADYIENIKAGDELIIPAYDQTDSKQWLADLNYKKEQERQRLLALQRQQEKERQYKLRLAAKKRNTYYRSSTSGRSTTINTGGANGYPYGWCTYYAASRKNIPSQWGNGGQWLGSAQRSGYATGSTPKPGAIIVTGESWAGHVGIVESVNGNNVTISEMNYNGWGVKSSRTINAGNPVIKGYVY